MFKKTFCFYLETSSQRSPLSMVTDQADQQHTHSVGSIPEVDIADSSCTSQGNFLPQDFDGLSLQKLTLFLKSHTCHFTPYRVHFLRILPNVVFVFASEVNGFKILIFFACTVILIFSSHPPPL